MKGLSPRASEATKKQLREYDHFPLSLAQEPLWFFQYSQPESPLYNSFCDFRLVGPLDIRTLERSLNEIVRRHEALRTTFLTNNEGEPRQVVAPALNLRLEIVDLRSFPPADRETEQLRRAREDARRPFDLNVGPLFRASLLHLDEQEHVLLLRLHHLVSDAWSMSILARELGSLYHAFATGKGSPLPDLPVQYPDFASWQRQFLQGNRLDQQLTYWMRRLTGASYLLNLPLDRPRRPVPAYEGSTHSFHLSSPLSATIRTLSRQRDVTLFMTLLAAFAGCLSRYTGQADILIGSPVANRFRADLEPLIGFFVNTVVMRVNLSGDPSFLELLSRVRETTLEAYTHSVLPLEMLVRELRPARDSSHTPLIQAAFAFQNVPFEPLKLPGISVTSLEIHNGTAKFDLALSITDTTRGLACSLEYRTDLFDAGTIVRMGRHFERLLAGAVADPSRRLSSLPMMTGAEREELLASDASTELNPACGWSLGQLFEAQVDLTPDAVAVTYGSEHLTYHDLNARANHVAHCLRRLGVRPEIRVGVCVDRSPDILIALLGVLKAGGAYVPLDPTHPTDRLAFMVHDAGAQILLTTERLASLLPDRDVVKVNLAADSANEANLILPNLVCTATEDNLAYVIYTSGSTGIPKGVGVTHRNVTRLFTMAEEWARFGKDDVWTLFHSYAFDFSVWEMWGALLYGGRLVVVPQLVTQSREQFWRLLRTERVTVLNQTPSAFRRLLGDADAWTGMSLHLIVLGGEPLASEELADWQQRLRGVRLVNMYGITETTVHVTRHEPARHKPQRGAASVIGRPLADMRLYVLDSGMNLVPRGVSGELYVGGSGVARGYLGRPGLTASRFLPDPYGPCPGGRLYRTGDLARYLGDGNYAYIGRADRQVKLRGYRIELGEVEAALLGHPNVREAAVVLHSQSAGETGLVAYLSGAETPVEALRGYLGERLPGYMAPSTYVWFEKLPLTPNGKVDYSALPDPSSERPSLSTRYEAPRTPEEHVVAGVWRKVLGIERIGIHDNFFDLGGGSLTILKVKDELEDLLATPIPTVVFFQQPTVCRLAANIGMVRRDVGSTVAASQAERVAPSVALSHGNARVAPNDIAVIGVAGRFPGAADARTLWSNLCAARESISVFSDDELHTASVPPALIRDRRYVRSRGVLQGVEFFDYEFFGFNARDARTTDPQHRLFLEVCWQALADAGCAPDRIDFPVGVFAGAGSNHYRDILAAASDDDDGLYRATELGNEKDYLTTTVSYRLRLTGPSVDVQTACSTSLVAVHLACRSLVDSDCDMALAGGVSIVIPENTGYLHTRGGIGSPDGHCRAFDKDAAGCVPGNGAGVIVLKRLADAVRDEDYIYAVIKGSAVNNDGGRKVGFTAPSVEGQADVIRRALRAANLSPGQVAYLEAHGTGTALGDPIEIEALRQVFEGHGARSCGLGSIKTNIGHLDVAAGIAGLIKTVLAIKHRQLPASLHFREANPQIDFSTTPFFVVQRLSSWPARNGPLVAGVSSFGIGGTNAHIVIASASDAKDTRPARRRDVLLVSARTPQALEASRTALAEFLLQHADITLEDLCCTLQTARTTMLHRFAAPCASRSEAVNLLQQAWTPDARNQLSATGDRRLAFLFPGEGSMSVGLVHELYRNETVFREEVDSLIGKLPAEMEAAIRMAFDPASPPQDNSCGVLLDKQLGQPFHVVSQLALANSWRRWGVEPAAVIGYGLGELSTAVVAGALTPTDALRLLTGGDLILKNNTPSGELMPCLNLSPPRIPIVSAETGDWRCSHDARLNWAEDAKPRAGFSRGLRTLSDSGFVIWLEIRADAPLAANAQHGVASHLCIRAIRSLADAGAGLETALAELWEAGVHVDWVRYRVGARGRRVPLPGYPFERRRCWIDVSKRPAGVTRSGVRVETPVWKRVPASRREEYSDTKIRLMVLAPTREMAAAIRFQWRALEIELTMVILGGAFKQLSAGDFVIRPEVADDYQTLVSRLCVDGRLPTTVVHTIGAACFPPGEKSRESPGSVASHAHSSLLRLARALARSASHRIRWYVVAKGLFNITGEELRDPEHALLAGAVGWLSSQALSAHTELCEIDKDAGDAEVADGVLERLTALAEHRASGCYSRRGRHRWSQSLEDVSGWCGAGVPFGEPNAVYLVTGNASPLWRGLCEHLSARRAAALILLSDESVPPVFAWPQFVESRGGHVDIKTARPAPFDHIRADTRVYSWRCDLTDPQVIRDRIVATERQVGPIRGAIYSPLLAYAPPRAQTMCEAMSEVLQRSMDATRALHAALWDRTLDFSVCLEDLCVGVAALDADGYLAGAFAEVLVENAIRRGGGTPGLVVRVRSQHGALASEGAPSAQCPTMILPGGWDTLGAALQSGVCSITISSTTGQDRAVPPQSSGALASVDTAPAVSSLRDQIASIWCELLGLPAGLADGNFFALGGHSLMALDLATRLGSLFGGDVALRDILEHPTLYQLADFIGARQPSTRPEDLFEQVLRETEESAPRSWDPITSHQREDSAAATAGSTAPRQTAEKAP
jgi:amino acid adenylation domain-containing protein